MTTPTRRAHAGSREVSPQMTEPRADGPTGTSRHPSENATRLNQLPPRVEFDNYKASYLRV
jgi:hypothetical protein